MNGQMKRYRESLMNTPGPVPADQIPKVRIDYKGLLSFAKEKGVAPIELSFEEKALFITEVAPGGLEQVRKLSM